MTDHDCTILTETLGIVVEEVNDLVLIIDLPNKVKYLNKAAKRFFRIDEAIKSISLEHLEKRGIFLLPLIASISKNNKRELLINELVDERRIVMEGIPLYNQHEKMDKEILIIARDITRLDDLQNKLECMEKREQRINLEVNHLRQKLLNKKELVVGSKAMENIMELVSRVAKVDSNVLILGESGVGKEVITKSIHDMSPRYMGPFVKIDCSSIPETLIESEIFGYEAGAFTGANKEGKYGMIEMADKGTLFLDEIGELPLSIQVKLLQVLQDNRFRRVGATKSYPVNIRVIAATNRDLEKMVAEHKFREDLYYRLNVVPIRIPPLRERPEEIPILVDHFLLKINEKYSFNKSFSSEVIKIFLDYSWPGNIRELENIVERLIITTKERSIGLEDLPVNMKKDGYSTPSVTVNQIIPLKEAVEKVESDILRMCLEKYNSTTKVGKVLKVDQSTIVRKIHKYKIATNIV